MTCPSPEVLAAMAEDRLGPSERAALLDHLALCDDCRRTLLILGPRPALPARAGRRSWGPWAAAAAVLAVSTVAMLYLRKSPEPAPAGPSGARAIPPPPGPRPESIPTPPPVPVDSPKPVPAREPPPPKAPEESPVPAPAPEPPAPPPPMPAPELEPEPPRPPTAVVAAVLDRLGGEVFALSGGARTAAKAGREIRDGEGLECGGGGSWALVRFPDRTRLELEGDAAVREILDRGPAKGRRIIVGKGAVKAEVSRQPAGLATVFETPHGEAKVLGTALRITVDPTGTRLEVEEGKVELRNLEGRTVLVDSGNFAVAAPGLPLAKKRLPREEVLFAFDFEDGKRPATAAKGTAGSGPDRRLCLAGEADAAGGGRISFGDAAGLFRCAGGEVLSFEYWADPQAGSVNFHLWNSTRRQKHEFQVPGPVLGKWARVSARLADLGLGEGDQVTGLFIQATGSPPRRFYVDNLMLARPLNLRPRAESK